MDRNNKIYERLPLVIYCLSIYLFVLGAIHTLGRWALFPINIFDFMGVVDIAKSAAPSLALVLVFLVIQSILIYLINDKDLKEAAGSNAKLERFFNKVSAVIVWAIPLVVIISIMGLFFVIKKSPEILFEYGSMITIVIVIPISLISIMAYIIIINESLKRARVWYYYSMIYFTLALAPFFSFLTGFVGSVGIIRGTAFDYIATGIENGADDIMSRDRYLGYYAGMYFVWNPNGGIVKTLPSGQGLQFKKYIKN